MLSKNMIEGARQHDLSEEPLEDLLLTFEARKSSMDLVLESEAGRAELSVRQGRLNRATFGDQNGSDAVNSMLSLRKGSYQLRELDGASAPEGGECLSEIVQERLRGLFQTNSYSRRSSIVATIALERTAQGLPTDLSPIELRVLAAVNGRLSAVEIAARENGFPADTLQAVRRLADRDLLRPVRAATLSLGTRLNQGSESQGVATIRGMGAAPDPEALPPKSPIPARLAKNDHNRPRSTGYSSVPPASLGEDRVVFPKSLKASFLDAPAENSQGDFPRQISSALGAAVVVPNRALDGRESRESRPSSRSGSSHRPLSDLASLALMDDEDLDHDPEVVAAAKGQLRDSELPLPSSRLGRAARTQLDYLNDAVTSSRYPKLPALDDSELSQEYTLSPGSMPLPENLPRTVERQTSRSELPVVGRYEVLARLKRGGMGSVYLSRLSGSAGFRRHFAMKVLHGHLAEQPDALDAFFHEARVLGGLHHRNIVGIADVGTPSEPYIVLDYVEGGSLAELFRASKSRRPPGLILRTILDALSGLDAAHFATDERGAPLHLVHCDVTPHNLLVGIDGTCRLTDFGISRTGEVDHRTEITKGKPGYLAPERLKKAPSDHRSDVFSLGVVLYAGLTGIEPFAADTAEATMRRVIEFTPPPPSEVGLHPPAALDWVCMKALAKNPDERFSSASEMAEQIRRIGDREGLIASSAEVADWVQETLSAALAARRVAAMRGTGSPESRYQESTIPPPSTQNVEPISDAPSAFEHTGPIESPVSSRSFRENTQILSDRALDAAKSKKRPLGVYLLVAVALGALAWSFVRETRSGAVQGDAVNTTSPEVSGDPSRPAEPQGPGEPKSPALEKGPAGDKNTPAPAKPEDVSSQIVIPAIGREKPR